MNFFFFAALIFLWGLYYARIIYIYSLFVVRTGKGVLSVCFMFYIYMCVRVYVRIISDDDDGAEDVRDRWRRTGAESKKGLGGAPARVHTCAADERNGRRR